MTSERGFATHHPLYVIWRGVIGRCCFEGNGAYKLYGARGIRVCDRWRHDFWAFVDDMGERPEGFSIERVDNDGDYEPGNCIWASRLDQCRNTRRTRLVTFNGRTQMLSEWSAEIGISQRTLRDRLEVMSVEEALTQPNRRGKSWKQILG